MSLPTIGNQNFRINCKSYTEILGISPKSFHEYHQDEYNSGFGAPATPGVVPSFLTRGI